ncbi:hypothetical protein RA210_U590001 [Rubrivivax sp. A210]|nr:hypothetical protein RA210_U590001 [Rubrivivax sp. A210]
MLIVVWDDNSVAQENCFNKPFQCRVLHVEHRQVTYLCFAERTLNAGNGCVVYERGDHGL